MGSPRKNFSKGYQTVKNNFQEAVGNLFEKQHNGTKCNNAIFITVLFCALCRIQSLFAACRNLAGSPDDRTVATAILKTLPEYSRLQKLVNETLSEQLPKTLFRTPKRLAIDLVLIPYHGKHCYDINEIYRSQPKNGTSHFHAYATVCVLHKGFRYTITFRCWRLIPRRRCNSFPMVPMFIRPIYIKSKGKRLAYWALVESYRTEKGPRQRTVAYLGQLKDSTRNAFFVLCPKKRIITQRKNTR